MKKKNLLYVLLFSCLLLTGCGNGTSVTSEESEPSEYHEIQHQYILSFETNGGDELEDQLYASGDSVDLPKPFREGFKFDGWYLDRDLTILFDETKEITGDTTFYAKWSVKKVLIYLDTAIEGEFEPIEVNVGSIFDISNLPTSVASKDINGIRLKFMCWVDGGENPVTTNFVVEDCYYSFHPQYGDPDLDCYKKLYETDFNTNTGYIDNEHSWSRGMDLPTAAIGQSAPTQDIFMYQNSLRLRQLTHSGAGYGAKALLPYDITQNLREYSVSATFKFTEFASSLSSFTSKANDIGFGIMTRFDNITGANVAAMVDPGSKVIRISGTNKDYVKSGTDVNAKFSYDIPTIDLNQEHTLKVVLKGTECTTSSELTNTTMYVYFDGNACWNTKDVILNKNWFYSGQADKNYIGLTANACEVAVSNVVVKNVNETETLYEKSFTSTYGDGWTFSKTELGGSVGEIYASDGTLKIDTYYKNQTILKHQLLYAPTEKVKNALISTRFKFDAASATDKYLALVFRGNEEKFSSFFIRGGSGTMYFYKHGETGSNKFTDWGTSKSAGTFTGGFGDSWHDLILLIKDDFAVVMVDGKIVFQSTLNDTSLWSEAGYVGLLSSSVKVEFDNFSVFDLDKEAE